MPGSRLCWQLLLGCALLLGQPVFGDSDTTEEPSLEEPEEPVPVSQEPEELVPVSQEPEESVPVSEELEEPVPELEEPELPDKPEELTSDEKLEKKESEEREWLQEELSRPWNFKIQDMQWTVLEHHQKHSKEYYMPFENANLRTQKAIGTMVYLQMIVAKTNCTNDQQPKEEESDYSYYHRLYHSDRYPRNCEPLGDSEKKDCRVTFFEDARNPGEPIVVDHWCNPFHENSGRDNYINPYYLMEYE